MHTALDLKCDDGDPAVVIGAITGTSGSAPMDFCDEFFHELFRASLHLHCSLEHQESRRVQQECSHGPPLAELGVSCESTNSSVVHDVRRCGKRGCALGMIATISIVWLTARQRDRMAVPSGKD